MTWSDEALFCGVAVACLKLQSVFVLFFFETDDEKGDVLLFWVPLGKCSTWRACSEPAAAAAEAGGQ